MHIKIQLIYRNIYKMKTSLKYVNIIIRSDNVPNITELMRFYTTLN